MKSYWYAALITVTALTTNTISADSLRWLHELTSPRVNQWVDKQNTLVETSLLQSKLFKANKKRLSQLKQQSQPTSYNDGYYVFKRESKGIITVSTVLDPNRVIYEISIVNLYPNGSNYAFKVSCLEKTTYCIIGGAIPNQNKSHWFEFDLSTSKRTDKGFSLFDSELVQPKWVDQNTILYTSDHGLDKNIKSKMALHLKIWKRNGNKSSTLLSKTKEEAIYIDSSVVNQYSDSGLSKVIPAPTIYSDYSLGYLQLPFINGKLITKDLPLGAKLLGVYNNSLLYWIRKDWMAKGRLFEAGSIVDLTLDKHGVITSVNEQYKLPKGYFLDSSKIAQQHIVIVGFKGAEMFIGTIDLTRKSQQFSVIYTHAIQKISLKSATPFSSNISFSTESMLTAPATYQYNLSKRKLTLIEKEVAQFNTQGMVEELKFAKSADGKLIPYRIAYPKNVTGSVDTILYTSGVYGISRYANHSTTRGKLWLEKGKAYIISHPRGGSELGPNWYLDGIKDKKVNTIEDVVSIAKDVFKLNISKPEQLALLAGRGGGAISGAVGYKYPSLFKASYHEDSTLDIINWADTSDFAEFGNPKTDELEYLQQYSPYQQIKKGVTYPISLFVASRYDPEVHPAQSRKTAKRLQDYGQSAYYYETNAAGKYIIGDLKDNIEQLTFTFFEHVLSK
jgi:prolyl oligopeptidase